MAMGEEMPYGIDLAILSARGLMKADLLGKSDPYVTVDWRTQPSGRTAVIRSNLNPVWENESFRLPLAHITTAELSSVTLLLTVWDYDAVGSHDSLGCVHLTWPQLLDACHGERATFRLKKRSKKTDVSLPEGCVTAEGVPGVLTISLSAADDTSPAALARAIFDTIDVTGEGSLRKDLVIEQVQTHPDIKGRLEHCLALYPLLRPRLWKHALVSTETAEPDLLAWKEWETFCVHRLDAARALEMPRSIHVEVVSARGLMKADLIGKSDPYVTVDVCGSLVGSTSVIKSNLNPVWSHETFDVALGGERALSGMDDYRIVLTVRDYDTVGAHDFLGCVVLTWADLQEHCNGGLAYFQLQQPVDGKKTIKKLRGSLCLKLWPVKDRSPAAMARHLFDAVDVAGNGEMSKVDLAAAITTRKEIATMLRPCLALQPLLRPRLWMHALMDLTGASSAASADAKSGEEGAVELKRAADRWDAAKARHDALVAGAKDLQDATRDDHTAQEETFQKLLAVQQAKAELLEAAQHKYTTERKVAKDLKMEEDGAGQPGVGEPGKMIRWKTFERFCVAPGGVIASALAAEMPGGVRVRVVSARGLLKADLIGKSDPYCRVQWSDDILGSTVVIRNSLDPVWDGETFDLSFWNLVKDPRTSTLVVTVMDHDSIGNHSCIGCAVLTFDDLLAYCHGHAHHFRLQQPLEGKPVKKLRGSVCLELTPLEDMRPEAVARQIFDMVDTSGEGTLDASRLMQAMEPPSQHTTTTTGDPPILEYIRRTRVLHPLLSRWRWNSSWDTWLRGQHDVSCIAWEQFCSSPDNSIHKLREMARPNVIKLRIFAARELLAADGSLKGQGTSDPYCRILWGGEQVGVTEVVRNSLNPTWGDDDEVFDLQCPKSAEDLARIELEIKVFDHDKVGSHDFLGSIVIPGADLVDRCVVSAGERCSLDLASEPRRTEKERRKPGGKRRRGTLVLSVEGTVDTTPAAVAQYLFEMMDADGAGVLPKQSIIDGIKSSIPVRRFLDETVSLRILLKPSTWTESFLRMPTRRNNSAAAGKRGAGTNTYACIAWDEFSSFCSAPGGAVDQARRRELPAAVFLTVVSARDLVKADLIGHSDPYVEVEWNGVVVGRTEVKPGTREPHWEGETFKLPLIVDEQQGSGDVRGDLRVVLYDHDRVGSHDFLGSASLSINDMMAFMAQDARPHDVHPDDMEDVDGEVSDFEESDEDGGDDAIAAGGERQGEGGGLSLSQKMAAGEMGEESKSLELGGVDEHGHGSTGGGDAAGSRDRRRGAMPASTSSVEGKSTDKHHKNFLRSRGTSFRIGRDAGARRTERGHGEHRAASFKLGGSCKNNKKATGEIFLSFGRMETDDAVSLCGCLFDGLDPLGTGRVRRSKLLRLLKENATDGASHSRASDLLFKYYALTPLRTPRYWKRWLGVRGLGTQIAEEPRVPSFTLPDLVAFCSNGRPDGPFRRAMRREEPAGVRVGSLVVTGLDTVKSGLLTSAAVFCEVIWCGQSMGETSVVQLKKGSKAVWQTAAFDLTFGRPQLDEPERFELRVVVRDRRSKGDDDGSMGAVVGHVRLRGSELLNRVRRGGVASELVSIHKLEAAEAADTTSDATNLADATDTTATQDGGTESKRSVRLGSLTLLAEEASSKDNVPGNVEAATGGAGGLGELWGHINYVGRAKMSLELSRIERDSPESIAARIFSVLDSTHRGRVEMERLVVALLHHITLHGDLVSSELYWPMLKPRHWYEELESLLVDKAGGDRTALTLAERMGDYDGYVSMEELEQFLGDPETATALFPRAHRQRALLRAVFDTICRTGPTTKRRRSVFGAGEGRGAANLAVKALIVSAMHPTARGEATHVITDDPSRNLMPLLTGKCVDWSDFTDDEGVGVPDGQCTFDHFEAFCDTVLEKEAGQMRRRRQQEVITQRAVRETRDIVVKEERAKARDEVEEAVALATEETERRLRHEFALEAARREADRDRSDIINAEHRASEAERQRQAAQTDAVLANVMLLRVPQNKKMLKRYADMRRAARPPPVDWDKHIENRAREQSAMFASSLQKVSKSVKRAVESHPTAASKLLDKESKRWEKNRKQQEMHAALAWDFMHAVQERETRQQDYLLKMSQHDAADELDEYAMRSAQQQRRSPSQHHSRTRSPPRSPSGGRSSANSGSRGGGGNGGKGGKPMSKKMKEMHARYSVHK